MRESDKAEGNLNPEDRDPKSILSDAELGQGVKKVTLLELLELGVKPVAVRFGGKILPKASHVDQADYDRAVATLGKQPTQNQSTVIEGPSTWEDQLRDLIDEAKLGLTPSKDLNYSTLKSEFTSAMFALDLYKRTELLGLEEANKIAQYDLEFPKDIGGTLKKLYKNLPTSWSDFKDWIGVTIFILFITSWPFYIIPNFPHGYREILFASASSCALLGWQLSSMFEKYIIIKRLGKFLIFEGFSLLFMLYLIHFISLK